MLRCVIIKDDKKVGFDFCGKWETFEKALSKIDLIENIQNLKVNDSNYEFRITSYSKDIYKKIKSLISPEDKLYDIYYVCKKAQYDNIHFFSTEFVDKYRHINNITELRNLYVKYSHNLYNSINNNDCNRYPNINLYFFEPMKLFGHKVLFTESRIASKDLPKELYKYELREDGENIVEIGKSILINHYGTIISNKKIKLNNEGYRDIDELKDIKYSIEPEVTLKQYMNEFKVKNMHR